MKAKEYLFRLTRIRDRERRITDEVRRLEASIYGAGGVRYDKLNVQTSAGNALEDGVIRLMESKEKLLKIKRDYYAEYDKILRQIEGLDRAIYRDVLIMRYVDGKEFMTISRQLNYSHKYITSVHGWALRAFEEKYLIEKDEEK